MNALAKLLLLFGTGYAGYKGQERQNTATEYDWQRQADIDAMNKRNSDLEYQDRLNQANALKDYNTAASTIPGMPGYTPPPGVMGYGQTTMSRGKFGPGSPFGAMPEGYAPGVAPPLFGTEEEAIPALYKTGITNPYALEHGERTLRAGLPSQAENRQKELQGREDAEYARGDDTFTTPDGRVVKYRDAARDRQANPQSYRERATEEDIAAYNRRAIAYGKQAITGAITLDELTRRREALDDEVAMDTQFKNQAALKQGQEFTAQFVAPTPGGDQPIGYDARIQGLATNTPIPQNAPIPPEISRERFLRESGGLDPIARAEAERGLGDIFDQRDKAAAEASKLVEGRAYRMGADGQPELYYTGELLPASVVNQNMRTSLQALETPSKIGSREAGTDLARRRTDHINWEETVKFPADEEYRKTVVALRQRGLELQADKMEQDERQHQQTLDRLTSQFEADFGLRSGNAAWDRFVDVQTVNHNNAGEMKAYLDELSKQKKALLVDGDEKHSYTKREGGGTFGFGGKDIWYSASGLNLEQYNKKMAELDAAIAKVMPDYTKKINALLGFAANKPFKDGQIPPYNPGVGNVPAPTGAPTGLPTIPWQAPPSAAPGAPTATAPPPKPAVKSNVSAWTLPPAGANWPAKMDKAGTVDIQKEFKALLAGPAKGKGKEMVSYARTLIEFYQATEPNITVAAAYRRVIAELKTKFGR